MCEGSLVNKYSVRIAPVWTVSQRVVVIHYQRFGTTFLSRLEGLKNPRLLTLDDGTDMLSRNVGKDLPLLAA